jgi:hypothetical protein
MTMGDELETSTAAEFAGYRQVAAEAFTPPSTEVVFATARARTVRRRAAAAVAVAAAVVTVLVTGTVVAGAITANEPVVPATRPPATTGAPPTTEAPPATATPPTTPSPTPDGGTGEDPQPVPDQGNRVRFLDDETAQRIRGATIELAAWPGSSSQRCPAGEYSFTDGRATIGEDPSGFPWNYTVLVDGQHGIFADLDGEAGDEILVPLGCGINELQFGLLALKPVGGGFETMGYVVVEANGLGSPDRFFPDGDELVVEVKVPGIPGDFEQRRRYRWQDAEFVQVGGPTEMPADPTDLTEVDLRNWSFPVYIEGEDTPCGTGGTLSFVDGGSGVWSYESQSDGVSWPAAEYLMYGVSRGSLDVDGDARPATLVTLTCARPDGLTETWVHHVFGRPVVRVGDDGATAIVSHRIVDGLAEVTVETADGEQTRRYRTDGIVWERVQV